MGRSSDASAPLGMEGFDALASTEADGECVVLIETVSRPVGRPSCDGSLTGARVLTVGQMTAPCLRIDVEIFLGTSGDERQLVTRPSPFQASILAAFGVDTSPWRSRFA